MVKTHDNVDVKRVLTPSIPRKLWTARYVFEHRLWCKCFSKIDHGNFIVGSIIFVLLKLTIF